MRREDHDTLTPVRVSRDLESALRREGLAVKQERTRGHVDLKIWAGTLGVAREAPLPFDRFGPPPTAAREVAGFVTTSREELDHHDRVQIALGLAHVVRPLVPRPRLWLTRSGSPEACPEDLAWLSAATQAWGTLDLSPDFAIITREGWCLMPSGQVRRWKRLRA